MRRATLNELQEHTVPNSGNNLGIIIVDHGSRRAESNDMLVEVARMFQRLTGRAIVEPAHMELAEPSIAQAFDRCVEQGADVVVVHPYFLLPGRHWAQDIPALTAEAAARHPGVRFLVTAPLAVHEGMARVMEDRIRHCLDHVAGKVGECDVCIGTGRCQMLVGGMTNVEARMTKE